MHWLAWRNIVICYMYWWIVHLFWTDLGKCVINVSLKLLLQCSPVSTVVAIVSLSRVLKRIGCQFTLSWEDSLSKRRPPRVCIGRTHGHVTNSSGRLASVATPLHCTAAETHKQIKKKVGKMCKMLHRNLQEWMAFWIKMCGLRAVLHLILLHVYNTSYCYEHSDLFN